MEKWLKLERENIAGNAYSAQWVANLYGMQRRIVIIKRNLVGSKK